MAKQFKREELTRIAEAWAEASGKERTAEDVSRLVSRAMKDLQGLVLHDTAEDATAEGVKRARSGEFVFVLHCAGRYVVTDRPEPLSVLLGFDLVHSNRYLYCKGKPNELTDEEEREEIKRICGSAYLEAKRKTVKKAQTYDQVRGN